MAKLRPRKASDDGDDQNTPPEPSKMKSGRVAKKKKVKLPERLLRSKKVQEAIAEHTTPVPKESLKKSSNQKKIPVHAGKKVAEETIPQSLLPSTPPANEQTLLSAVAKRTRARTKVTSTLRATVIKRLSRKLTAVNKEKASETATKKVPVSRRKRKAAGTADSVDKESEFSIKRQKLRSKKDAPVPEDENKNLEKPPATQNMQKKSARIAQKKNQKDTKQFKSQESGKEAKPSSSKSAPAAAPPVPEDEKTNLDKPPAAQNVQKISARIAQKRNQKDTKEIKSQESVKKAKPSSSTSAAGIASQKASKATKKPIAEEIEIYSEPGPSSAPHRPRQVVQKPPEAHDRDLSEDEASDKENVVSTRAQVHAPPSPEVNRSEEKRQPIYKTFDAKPTTVPKDKLIVMEEKPLEADDAFEFPLSQEDSQVSGSKKKNRKKRKKLTMPTPKRKVMGEKMWENKNVKKAMKKPIIPVKTKADKLEEVPRYIREKIKENQMKRVSFQSSTPIRPATETTSKMQMAHVMSPIQSTDDSAAEDDRAPAEEEMDIPLEAIEEIGMDPLEIQNPPALPWRSDDAINLPSTSRISKSQRDQSKLTKSDDAKTSPQINDTYSKSCVSEPVHISNFFGFETTAEDDDAPNPEIVQQHITEDALKKQREHVKNLNPKISTKNLPPGSPVRRKNQPKQLILTDIIPSTSTAQPCEVPSHPTEGSPSKSCERSTEVKSYTRKKQPGTSWSEVEDSEEELEEVKILEDPAPAHEKPKKYKKKASAKPKVNKKDLEMKKELEEYYNSFNEMCEEVDQFEPIIETDTSK
ncbi:hypothetical protein DMENIID0001_007750 [Sergentomyia squamirostris]